MNYTVNETKCKQTFNRLNNRLKNKWYKLNSTSNVGCMTYLYKKYNNPETYQQFYNMYVSDEGDNPKTCGRNEEYINNVATQLGNLDGNKEALETYYDYIIQKLIIDTFNGLKKETEMKQRLEKAGYRCEEPTYYEDTNLAIDFKIYKNGKLYCLAQVKPHTFFIGNNNYSLINDRKIALQKQAIAEKQFFVPVVYFIYNKNSNEWMKNSNGKIAHRLANLINSDGTTKNVI